MSTAHLTKTQSALLTATDLLREEYLDQAPEMAFRFGRVTERLFKPATRAVGGDGVTLQVIAGRTDSARASRNPSRDFGDQRPFSAGKIKFRFDMDDVTANDFTELQGVAEIPHLDLIRGDEDEIAVNVAESVRRQLMENAQDSHPILLHATAAGRVALVNDTPKDDDDIDYDSAGSYTSGATTARFKIDGGSIAAFEPGTRWDAYSAAGALLADEMEVTHKNVADNSIGVKLTTTGPNQSSVANLDSLANDAELFRSGEKDGGMRSGLTNWFSVPSSGETFIGGVDRTTNTKRWLLPTFERKGAASAAVRRDFLDDAALNMGFVLETGKSAVAFGHPSLIQTLRRSIGEDVLKTEGPNPDGNYTFGELGVTFQHPQFGKMTMLADPLAPPDVLKIIVPENWTKLYYGFTGFQMFDGDMGIWYRKEGANAGGGKSKFYRCEGYELCGLFSKSMRDQAVVMNLTA